MLVDAIVITGHGAGADVAVFAQRCIAKIAEMTGFGPAAEPGFFRFDKVANFHAFRQLSARANARKGSKPATCCHHCTLDYSVSLYCDAITEFGIFNDHAGTDGNLPAKPDLTFEYDIDVDETVFTGADCTANVQPCRIGKGDASMHEAFGLTCLVVALELGQLQPVVDSGDFLRRLRVEAFDGDVTGNREGDQISQVVLALSVIRLQVAKQRLHLCCIQRKDAGIYLIDLALVGIGIGVLNDCANLTISVADDAPELGRLGKLSSDEPEMAMLGNSHTACQSLASHQRHIAVHDEHGRIVAYARQCLLHGMTGTALFALLHPAQVRLGHCSGDSSPDFGSLVADDDMGLAGFESGYCGQHMLEQGPSSQPVQHFGIRRAHPRALARGKDDDLEWNVYLFVEFGHSCFVNLSRQSLPDEAQL